MVRAQSLKQACRVAFHKLITMPVWLLRLAGQVYAVGGLFTRQEPRLTPEKVALVTSRVHADGSKAVQELGFDATVPLETMLRRCIDWMRETGRL